MYVLKHNDPAYLYQMLHNNNTIPQQIAPTLLFRQHPLRVFTDDTLLKTVWKQMFEHYAFYPWQARKMVLSDCYPSEDASSLIEFLKQFLAASQPDVLSQTDFIITMIMVWPLPALPKLHRWGWIARTVD